VLGESLHQIGYIYIYLGYIYICVVADEHFEFTRHHSQDAVEQEGRVDGIERLEGSGCVEIESMTIKNTGIHILGSTKPHHTGIGDIQRINIDNISIDIYCLE